MAAGSKRTDIGSDTTLEKERPSKLLKLDETIDALEKIDINEPPDPNADENFLRDLYDKQSFIRDELRVVLIGRTGCGKSATGNTILGRQAFESKMGLMSVTANCQDCMMERFGRQIQVVDTPGLFDTRMTNEDVVKEIKKCVLMTSPGIHAVILVKKIGRFTDEDRKSLQDFQKLFGEGLRHYLMIVFTFKDDLEAEGVSIEEYTRTATPHLKQLLIDCGNRYMILNNRAPKGEKEIFAQTLLENIEKMVEQNGGRCYTSAMFRKAEAIMREVEEEEKRKLEDEKRKEREAIESCVKEKYESILKAHEEETKALKSQIEVIEKRVKEQRDKHQQSLAQLTAELEHAETERKAAENESKKWEETMEKQKKDIKKDMMLTMTRMEEERRRRVEELELRISQIGEERRRREEEMKKRQAEQDKREETEKRLLKMERETQEHLEKVLEEQSRLQQHMSERMQQQVRERARIRLQRHVGCLVM